MGFQYFIIFCDSALLDFLMELAMRIEYNPKLTKRNINKPGMLRIEVSNWPFMELVLVNNVSYSAPTSRTQKLKLMREDGHFTYSSIFSLACSSRRA
jgi:hypothetical protein